MDRRLSLGVEYNPLAEEVGPLLNYMIAEETETRPMINFGTSSDRIGTPAGPSAYYLTFAKTLPGSNVVPYVSLNYSEYDGRFNIPFGANIFLDDRWVLLPMFDGNRSHLMLTHRGSDCSVSLMLVWMKHPGISISWGF